MWLIYFPCHFLHQCRLFWWGIDCCSCTWSEQLMMVGLSSNPVHLPCNCIRWIITLLGVIKKVCVTSYIFLISQICLQMKVTFPRHAELFSSCTQEPGKPRHPFKHIVFFILIIFSGFVFSEKGPGTPRHPFKQIVFYFNNFQWF